MKKRIFYTEVAYALGQILLALGTALVAQGGFGMSMVVAPAYVLHLKLSEIWSWFGFGTAEYLLQILILLLMMAMLRKVKAIYFLSILSAVIYGSMLDGAMWLVGLISVDSIWVRIILYALGVLTCTASLSLLFYSYLPPAAYEMLVKQLSAKFDWKLTWVKTVYDLCSMAVSVGLSMVLLGRIEAVGIGTVICAVSYGFLIGGFSKLFSRVWEFQDRFNLRKFFEGP